MDIPDRDPARAAKIQALFDSIINGNLLRVKATLAEDPDLLFADPGDRGSSPAIAALDSGHHDITDYLAREELRRLEEGSVPERELYGTLHDLGEVAHATTGYPLTDQLRRVAEPVVVKFLTHEDESLRGIAVNVLGLHWNLRAHRETFTSMMFEDRDDDVRRTATACLGHVLQESRDWEATRSLLRKLRDSHEEESIRETAYEALLSIWRGFEAEHRFFLKVLEARRSFDAASIQVTANQEYEQGLRTWEEAGRVWREHVDREFIAALEKGEEP